MKISYFINSIVLMGGSILFLFLIAYGGNFVYSTYFEAETFASGTYIATTEISGLTREEATAAVEAEVNEWKQSSTVLFRWFEQEVHSGAESIIFLAEESVANANMDEASVYELITNVELTYIHDHLDQFTFYSVENDAVNEEQLEIYLSEAVADLPAENISLSIHDFTNEDFQQESTVLYNTNRNYDSPLLQAWAEDLTVITIEGESRFSLLEKFDDEHIESAQGKPLSILGSAVFEVLLHSNFELIERHQNEKLMDEMPLGYDTYIVKDTHDLVFDNPNPIDYQLEITYSDGSLLVGLVGESLPYNVSIDLADVHDLEPKTVVQYTEQLSFGASSIEKAGESGTTFNTIRTFQAPETNWEEEQWVANDYYPPEHRVELWSAEDYRSAEEEQESGFPEDTQPPLDENGQLPPDLNPSDYDSIEDFIEDYYNQEGFESGDGNFENEIENGSSDWSEDDLNYLFWFYFWEELLEGENGVDGGLNGNGLTPPGTDSTNSEDNSETPSGPSRQSPDSNNGNFDFPTEDEDGNEIKGY